MSSTTIAPEIGRLSERVVAGTETLLGEIERDVADDRVSELAGELWDVTAEVEGLLETVDMEKVPSVIDAEALSELIDPDGIPAAIREHDPDLVLDLGGVRRAIELRELWNTVDLVAFRAASHRLRTELEDVVGSHPENVLGSDVADSSGGSEAAADLREYVADVESEATTAAIQQQAKKRVKEARSGVVEAHESFEKLHVANQHQAESVGRRATSRNPTAVSLGPAGPLPDSVSARFSTVPVAVRHAKVDPLPRIYARRWHTVGNSS